MGVDGREQLLHAERKLKISGVVLPICQVNNTSQWLLTLKAILFY